jgi:isoprenylcysteine carboxyl methyltransferase (ICMT) family protein YpbQ
MNELHLCNFCRIDAVYHRVPSRLLYHSAMGRQPGNPMTELTLWGWLAAAYFLVSRLAYVIGISTALRRQYREEYFSLRYGPEAGFRQFRRLASLMMYNDGVAFIVACLATAHTLHVTLTTPIRVGLGAVLVVIGVSTKVWAAQTLGARAYYWHNFFVPTPFVPLNPPGPYRYLKNPMYTVGYLQTYGLALAVASLPGLLAAAFAQTSILAFHNFVEKPHFELLTRADPCVYEHASEGEAGYAKDKMGHDHGRRETNPNLWSDGR